MIRNYKICIAYDGSRYYGWEHQPGKDTIQGKIEDVLSHLCEEAIEVIGAGRTDAGVHAQEMTANFKMDVSMTTTEIRDYLNRYLPDDIAVTEVKEAADRFHARYNATGKIYRYTCYDGVIKPIFDRKYTWALEKRLDTEKMKLAAEYLTGEHDFSSFCKAGQKNKSCVRNLDRIDIMRKGDYVSLIFHGDGFLRNMVRILTGTLVGVGLSELPPQKVKEILDGKNRLEAGITAPAKGLCLMSVEYN